jgi:uncharacterized protein with GYD domain
MPKYLFKGSYTAEGAKGLKKDGGSKRYQAAEALVKQVGGTLDAFYFTFGESDFVLIADLPDSAAAVAISLAVNATGALETHSSPLITVEEMDAAAKRKVPYRPPGR